eukprot:9502810-Pyramimonas_sp.AAC.2
MTVTCADAHPAVAVMTTTMWCACATLTSLGPSCACRAAQCSLKLLGWYTTIVIYWYIKM